MKYSYESSEMFLSMAQTEYQNEKDRAAALDSKITLSLPVISAYFFLLVQDDHIKELWSSVTNAGHITEAVTFALYLIATFAALSALLLMIHATWTHNFQELDITQSCTAKVMSMPNELFSARIAKYYLLQIEQNRRETRITSEEYHAGWIFGIGSLVCFLLYTVMIWLS